MRLVIILPLLFVVGCRFMPVVIRENNRSVKLFEDEKPVEAVREFGKLAVGNPFEPTIRSNLGLAMEKAGHNEKALSEYHMALRSNPKEDLKFQVLFNIARLHGEAKKVDEALSWYQKALDVKPDSREVKVNIELLLQQKQGGGEGKSKEQQPKDGQGEQKEQPNEPKKYQDPGEGKPTPRPFKSEELSQNDMKNILEELKRQEEKIRAKENKKPQKETPNGKDW